MLFSKKVIYYLLFFFLLTGATLSEIIFGKGLPFTHKVSPWSIGIFKGPSPLELSSPPDLKNPVLTADCVNDVPAEFVADPFMVREGSLWYLFFEVMNRRTDQGDIGFATSEDGRRWSYRQIVLDEPFHLSYPYVFKWKDDYYMIPESCAAKSIRLYKAVSFPAKWKFEKNLIEGSDFVDSSIVQHESRWWIFTSSVACDTLRVFFADDLTGPWTEHPESPVVKDNSRIARSGGRIIHYNNRLIRYAQDDEGAYGKQIFAFDITELTPSSYKEKEISSLPIVTAAGKGWNAKGMHNVDAHEIDDNSWIACVDGIKDVYVVLGIPFEY